MAAKKGNNTGRQFSKTIQPGKRVGRKSSLMEAFIHAMKLDDQDQDLSKEDATKLLRYILLCNKAQLEAVARNTDLPIAVLGQIKAIVSDMAAGRTDAIDKIWDKIFGKTTTPIELTGPNGMDLILQGPMSRRDYESLYKKLKCGA